MSLVDCLASPRGRVVAGSLGPWSWSAVCCTASRVRSALCDDVLNYALVDLMQQKTAVFKRPDVSMADKFNAVVQALQLIRTRFSCSGPVQDELENLLNLMLVLHGTREARTSVVTSEEARVHKQARIRLRNIDPQLFIDAVYACPCLYTHLCKVISRWPCSFQDRDLLLERGAAALPSLADSGDVEQVLAGMALGVRFTCGSKRRVALMEQSDCSAMICMALKLHSHDDEGLARAVAYFNNLANCEEQWPRLKAMDLEPMCREALARLGDREAVRLQAGKVLGVL